MHGHACAPRPPERRLPLRPRPPHLFLTRIHITKHFLPGCQRRRAPSPIFFTPLLPLTPLRPSALTTTQLARHAPHLRAIPEPRP